MRLLTRGGPPPELGPEKEEFIICGVSGIFERELRERRISTIATERRASAPRVPPIDAPRVVEEGEEEEA